MGRIPDIARDVDCVRPRGARVRGIEARVGACDRSSRLCPEAESRAWAPNGFPVRTIYRRGTAARTLRDVSIGTRESVATVALSCSPLVTRTVAYREEM